jgi:hypothetical protein
MSEQNEKGWGAEMKLRMLAFLVALIAWSAESHAQLQTRLSKRGM